ncbi:MAG: hypothetical protein FWH18_12645 [Marinilabiliaceae bacterium]|nr:hypothetical protein [Marinilabiliaceae bacterium]
MSSQKLHIICSAIPSPPDYGGAIDVYYKLKALHELGVEIILHCFEYKRRRADELKKYCTEIYYYHRKTGLLSQFSFIPYIIKSRQSIALLHRLVKEDFPILFEGMHTTAFLQHPDLAGRKQWIRAHNIEHYYYNSLVKTEKSLYKKIYYKIEAFKLSRYNSIHALADGVFAISQFDATFFEKINKKTILINAFHGYTHVTSKIGIGEYALYHGDLSVAENNRSAEFLIDICKNLPFNLIIAGKTPKRKLKKLVKRNNNIYLVDDPNTIEMEDLIQNAGVILLPATQKTGLRLKLLVSLFSGRHCIASPEMLVDTGLEKLCHIAENKEEWKQSIQICMKTPFTNIHIVQREKLLKNYMDIDNARKLTTLIFE